MIRQILTVAALATISYGVMAQESTTVKFDDVADAWVRTNNDGKNDGNSPKLEYRGVENADKVIDAYFYAMIGFNYELPAGKKVEKATLHFVTERVKGADTNIYGYTNDFSDNTTWAVEKDYVTKALETAPIYTARIAGQWNMSIGDGDKLKDEYKNLEAWTNTVDVTSYVKGISGQRVNFLFASSEKTGQNCIFSKEATAENVPAFVTDAEAVKPYLEVVFAEDAESATSALSPIADTWVRVGNQGVYGTTEQIEIINFEKTDGTTGTYYGLMEFQLPEEAFDADKYEVKSVSLRLFHKVVKGSRKLNLYAYPETVDENSNYAAVENFMTAALATDPIASYEAKGQGGKACYDKGVKDEYLTADAWTNTIDLTEYVKSLAATRVVAPSNIAFAIAKAEKENNNNDIRISSRETKDIEANKDEHPGVVFKAEDIKPILTVTYTKKAVSTTVSVVVDENAPVEYYNLNGIRMNGDNLAPGLYICRQGQKVTKILVK